MTTELQKGREVGQAANLSPEELQRLDEASRARYEELSAAVAASNQNNTARSKALAMIFQNEFLWKYISIDSLEWNNFELAVVSWFKEFNKYVRTELFRSFAWNNETVYNQKISPKLKEIAPRVWSVLSRDNQQGADYSWTRRVEDMARVIKTLKELVETCQWASFEFFAEHTKQYQLFIDLLSLIFPSTPVIVSVTSNISSSTVWFNNEGLAPLVVTAAVVRAENPELEVEIIPPRRFRVIKNNPDRANGEISIEDVENCGRYAPAILVTLTHQNTQEWLLSFFEEKEVPEVLSNLNTLLQKWYVVQQNGILYGAVEFNQDRVVNDITQTEQPDTLVQTAIAAPHGVVGWGVESPWTPILIEDSTKWVSKESLENELESKAASLLVKMFPKFIDREQNRYQSGEYRTEANVHSLDTNSRPSYWITIISLRTGKRIFLAYSIAASSSAGAIPHSFSIWINSPEKVVSSRLSSAVKLVHIDIHKEFKNFGDVKAEDISLQAPYWIAPDIYETFLKTLIPILETLTLPKSKQTKPDFDLWAFLSDL